MASEPTVVTSSTTRYEPFSPYYLHPNEGTSSIISPVILTGRGLTSHMAVTSSSEVSTGSIDCAHFPSNSDKH